MAHQVMVQIKSMLVTVCWSGAVAVASYTVCKLTIGLRVSKEAERQGLDIASHGEVAYIH